ncbi:receptor-type tyrosine-protein phosphatase F-like [Nematolebias whitei]|uniref:receptor-type tyrosine-protein phosphatase F-like n=1 Tax=Nematolebias whitei TaxID=451745 RepID=UPI0018980E10|nr:receptor-type tyrosine-protein phosphatase F-like [Nematolebias whitei]
MDLRPSSGLSPIIQGALYVPLLVGFILPSRSETMPSFIRSPDDQTGISGGVISFICQAVGEPRPRITWTKKGKKVSSQRFEVKEFDGGSGSVLRIQPLRTNRDEAIYECRATNSAAEITATVQLNILEEDQIPHGFPTIDMGPQLKVVERTTTATMLCAASGNPDPEIYWFKDMLPVDTSSSNGRIKQLRSGGTPIRGALQIENSNMSDEGKYECVAVNSAGTRFSSPANLYVRDQREVRRVPPRFSIPPTSQEVMPGGSVNLTCVAVGSPMPFVKWVSGEVELSQEDHLPVGRNILELTNIHQSSNYTCVAISDLGIIDATAQVFVKGEKQDWMPSQGSLQTNFMMIKPTEPKTTFKKGRDSDRLHHVTFSAAGSYAVDDLKPDTQYSFSLAARSARGLGVFTQPVEARTTQSMLGAPPRKVAAVVLNSTAIKVTWKPPLSVKHHGEIEGYRLICSRLKNGKPYGQQIDMDISGLENQHAIVSSLLPETLYSVTLAAYTTRGDGAPSKARVVMTKGPVPGKPIMMISTMTGNTALIQWQPPNEIVGEHVGYQLQYKRTDEETFTVRDFRKADDHFTVTGLHKGATYIFKLSAKNQVGTGEEYEKEISTPEDVPSSYPQNLSVIGLTSTSTQLSWDPPPLAERNGKILKYVVIYRDINSQHNNTNSTSETQMTVQDLQPDTTYDFRVQAFNSKGGGPSSPSIQSRTVSPSMSVFTKNFDVKFVTKSSVLLTWELSETVTSEVRLKILYGQQSVEVQGHLKKKLISQLQSDMEYSFRMMSQENGAGGLQQQVSIRTAPDLLSTKPTLYQLNQEEDRMTVILPEVPPEAHVRCFYIVVVPESQVSLNRWENPEYMDLQEISVLYIYIFCSKQERKRTTPAKDEYTLGMKDSLMALTADPVEIRRLNYHTQGMKEHPPIFICDLVDHIERLKANNALGFSQEYESIDPGQQFTWENSNLEVNKPKNRYANVIAYDHSRVILTPVDGVPGSTYINANYIDGYRKQNAYIATQGPLPETLCDFWRMVWEQRTSTIVMMTCLEERSRIKCEQYWPSRGTETYGMIQVTILDTVELATYVMRTFTFYKNSSGEKREVRQFQFLAWPDHGVPEFPSTTLAFLHKVQVCSPPDAGPIVVHCSAGVGRSGCFIVIDAMLERLKHEKSVDVYGHVTCMRAQRNYMVQTEEQYMFIHEALLEAATCGNTEVTTRNLYAHLQNLSQIPPGEPLSAMAQEFKKLTSTSSYKSQTARFLSANLPCNKFKNRLLNNLPFESTRVSLQPIRGVEGSDYINASFIDGYRHQRAYIATQGPLAETSEDLWKMLWEHNSTIVVMLTKLHEMGREMCHQYWPAEHSARYQYFVVDPVAEYNMPQYILREFKVTDARDGQSRTIRQFQFTDWPEQGVPKTGEAFVDFIGQVHKTKEQFGQDGPITVHCSAGVGRTGVFITISIMLERMRHEGVVDVFQTVKILRTQRPAMVQTEDQYLLCYRAALEYLGSFDNYAM